MEEKENLYPVRYDGKWWEKEDCGDIFISLYHTIYSLSSDSSVYVGDGSWVYPDDSLYHDEDR